MRTAWLDQRRGFFNGTSLCLRAEGHEAGQHKLEFGALPAGWDVGTALPPIGAGQFIAAGYDELVDHPVELGTFWRGRFELAGVPHEFVVAGSIPRATAEASSPGGRTSNTASAALGPTPWMANSVVNARRSSRERNP